MTKALVLAEKPSVGREIARVLGCKKTERHYIEGDHYIVTWALGHLIELKMPEEYDQKYKTWRIEDLPIIPNKMETRPIKQTRAQFQAISKLAKRKDLDSLIIATDAGREGELVARWIIKTIHWHKPIKRLWISSQTDKAIQDGFQHLSPAKDYDQLYQSAVCRSEADWLIGLNVSRALTVKYNDSLSAGRVQTPTLSMLLERENAIRTFKPKPYWILGVDVGGYTATWQCADKNRILSKKHVATLKAKISGHPAIVRQVTVKNKHERQPLPYDLTELQRDANRKFGFSAKKTLNVLQNLYEHHKIVTYPRTDSRYLTPDVASTMPERLKAVSSMYGRETRSILHKQKGKVLAKFVYNESKVSDHHALIPTEQPVFMSDLSDDERRLFDLVVRRFLALFYPQYQYRSIHAELDINGESFVLNVSEQTDPGFKQLSAPSDAPHPQAKLRLTQAQQLQVRRIRVEDKMTEPPARFSEADLLTKMEKYGLGTPATRADIIEKLLQAESVQRINGRLCPTAKGKQLIDLVNNDLKSAALTAEWEHQLEHIAKGKGNPQHFMTKIRKKTQQLINEVKSSEKTYKIQNLTGSKCPECGSLMKEVHDRDGARILVCINRECGYRKRRDPKLSNKRCPTCHKRMEMHHGKAGLYFQCRSCGIIVKADELKQKANKKETRRLLHQMNKESEPIGNSLADALKAAMKQKNE
ncbi:DNA topoisomerase III [Sporolactobacillus inulinus]|jgi:DNA topoisomerase-3|uniref:DNA topoisomerase n=2 Tax=Sporolactobacillus inulinus TaxID=2078 RepID=A0A0U1QR47_9BACL|nr:DNA topoisomerase III [Sporolactobacillus inulinus]KLI03243.1 DNA topoisomerase III [Sporolactobacillus inulinus CASD]GEB78125.1 DNA topoisomerase III [Sporolactobacillus inulinus]